MGNFSLRKVERLSRDTEIQELFQRGSSFHFYPLRVIWLPSTAPRPHQVLFSVSKRNFKRAVDRNKLKRRMREAYRLNKNLLPTAPAQRVAFVYIGKDLAPFETIQKSLVRALEKIAHPQP
jgi:ribonuclease P protein component